MALDRTWYNTLHNDSGGGLDGTLWDKEDVDALMDAVDAEINRLDGASDASTGAIAANTSAIAANDAELAAIGDPAALARITSPNTFDGTQTILMPANSPALVFRPTGGAASGRVYEGTEFTLGMATNAFLVTPTQWGLDDLSKGGAVFGVNRDQEFGVTYFPAGTSPAVVSNTPFKVNAAGLIYERMRGVAMGNWVDVPYNAANFSASGGGTWTVPAAAVARNRITLIGGTLIWSIYVSWFTAGALVPSVVAGTVNALRIALPPGIIAPGAQGLPMTLAFEGITPVTAYGGVVGANLEIVRTNFAPWTPGSVGFTGTVLLELL